MEEVGATEIGEPDSRVVVEDGEVGEVREGRGVEGAVEEVAVMAFW